MQKKWIVAVLSLAGILSGILAGFFWGLIHDLPQINHLKQYKPSAVSTVYSADNKVIARFYIEKRFPVKIDKIPDSLIQALITIEDRSFFSHAGVNIKAIIRAVIKDIQARRFKEGASTLTQQLAKTLFLTNEKSIVRKVKELLLSIQIERRYTKNEILELYLNQIYLGAGTYGVEAASKEYFKKSVSDLDLHEVALIAGLPKAPSVYNPVKNPQLARKRRDTVLSQMRLNNVITKDQYQDALKEDVAVKPTEVQAGPADYFVSYVRSIIKDQFDLKQVFSGGLNIQTSLNLDLQIHTNRIISEQMPLLEARMEKNGLTGKSPQCAVVAIDTGTGGIACMAGGTDYRKSVFNRAVQARRQPGSAFKPFVYALAIEKGHPQNEVLLDAPLSFRLENGKDWHVNNFSRSYSGRMTFRKALALSKNTPVVRLMEQIGPQNVAAFAKKLGIDSNLYPNLSLALGTSEVSLLELTGAYLPFANMGIKVEPYPIVKISDAQSNLIYQHKLQKQSVMKREDAAIMADMLKGVIREGTGRSALRIQKDIAGKTGTTDNYKDALFIGFSPGLALGVWVGNDDAATLGKYETGAKAALPIWTGIMQHYLSKNKTQYFDIPDGTKMVYMDPETGEVSESAALKRIKVLVKKEI